MRRAAFFLALDSFGHGGTLARAGLFLVMYQSFARPRAVLWQMFLVTAAIIYACTGMAYLLSQARALALSMRLPGSPLARLPAPDVTVPRPGRHLQGMPVGPALGAIIAAACTCLGRPLRTPCRTACSNCVPVTGLPASRLYQHWPTA